MITKQSIVWEQSILGRAEIDKTRNARASDRRDLAARFVFLPITRVLAGQE
jgi:hypothetical protein